MNYRQDKYGNELSVLGYGCMRFPRKNGRIDMAVAEKLICHAVEQGVNYFDTAYIYSGSEAAVGEILEKNDLRRKVNIATKLPHYLIKNREGLDKLFAEELRRLRTDHVDYYLMHMLNDVETWQRLLDMGIESWIREKKVCGAIRQVGFSYHGNSEMFCRLLDAYEWDFCQVQYNYLDEHSQAGRRGVEYAHSKGIPVIIMEPLCSTALAVGPEGSDGGPVRHGRGAYAPGESGGSFCFRSGTDPGGGTEALCGCGAGYQRNRKSWLHRMRLLPALSQGRGHSRCLCSL